MRCSSALAAVLAAAAAAPALAQFSSAGFAEKGIVLSPGAPRTVWSYSLPPAATFGTITFISVASATLLWSNYDFAVSRGEAPR